MKGLHLSRDTRLHLAILPSAPPAGEPGWNDQCQGNRWFGRHSTHVGRDDALAFLLHFPSSFVPLLFRTIALRLGMGRMIR